MAQRRRPACLNWRRRISAALLALARATIETRLGVPFVVEPAHRPVVRSTRRRVRDGVRRRQVCTGVSGCPRPEEPLGRVVRYCARAAAFGDPRFPPVTLADLRAAVARDLGADAARTRRRSTDGGGGTHGLVVEQGTERGLLLPQVATEHGWTREQFLDHTCIKAGLPLDAWRHGASLYRFEALVFGERGASR